MGTIRSRARARTTVIAALCLLGATATTATTIAVTTTPAKAARPPKTATSANATARANATASGTASGYGWVAPGAIHIGRLRADGPGSTADCEQEFGLPCYDPAQIAQAYNLAGTSTGNLTGASNLTGKGVTIAVADAFGSPTIWSDLVQFDQAYSLPNPSLKIISPAGRVPRYDKNNADMVGWAGETTLDVEWAHAIAPGANIVLVETPTDAANAMSYFNKAEDYVVRHHLAQVITQSFGAPEQASGPGWYIQSVRTAFRDAQRDHVTVLASAGDDGATGPQANGGNLYTYPVASWPASDPLVTAVGGTQLHLDDNGNRTSPDTVWNDTWDKPANKLLDGDNGPNALATGGGRSVLFARPSYQANVKRTTGASRGIPDVSMNGACSSPVNVYQSYPGQPSGWYAVCGTSESAPLFAGIVALADQLAGHPLGLINPTLYRLAAKHAPGIVPITSGDNTVTFSQGHRRHTVRGYRARNGYSRVGGVGTIDGQNFIAELAGK